MKRWLVLMAAAALLGPASAAWAAPRAAFNFVQPAGGTDVFAAGFAETAAGGRPVLAGRFDTARRAFDWVHTFSTGTGVVDLTAGLAVSGDAVFVLDGTISGT